MSRRRRVALGAALTITLGAHALLLAIPGRATLEAFRLGDGKIHAVWLAAAVAPAPAVPAVPLLHPTPPVPPNVVGNVPPASAAPAPMTPPASSPVAIAANPAPGDHPAVAEEELARYLPASALTQRALITSPIELNFDTGATEVQRGGSARLIVLISATGDVDRIVIEDSTLDEEIQALAVARFTTAHFKPGELDGIPVPARAVFEISDERAG